MRLALSTMSNAIVSLSAIPPEPELIAVAVMFPPSVMAPPESENAPVRPAVPSLLNVSAVTAVTRSLFDTVLCVPANTSELPVAPGGVDQFAASFQLLSLPLPPVHVTSCAGVGRAHAATTTTSVKRATSVFIATAS